MSCSLESPNLRSIEPEMRPFFLPGSAGNLFCVYHRPADPSAERGDLIFVPPFAEELNQSRHTVVQMARRCAERGIGVLLLDLFGTGDSEGTSEEARWEIWQEDVLAARAWLWEQGRRRIGLFGLRLGALLAVNLAKNHSGLFTSLVVWQPVTSGKTFVTQFLRIRTAGAMVHGSASKETTKELRERLSSGHSIDVGGYALSPTLAAAIDTTAMAKLAPPPELPVLWFDVGTTTSPSSSTERVLAEWRAEGANVTSMSVVEEPFWSLQSLEPFSAESLIEATVEAL